MDVDPKSDENQPLKVPPHQTSKGQHSLFSDSEEESTPINKKTQSAVVGSSTEMQSNEPYENPKALSSSYDDSLEMIQTGVKRMSSSEVRPRVQAAEQELQSSKPRASQHIEKSESDDDDKGAGNASTRRYRKPSTTHSKLESSKELQSSAEILFLHPPKASEAKSNVAQANTAKAAKTAAKKAQTKKAKTSTVKAKSDVSSSKGKAKLHENVKKPTFSRTKRHLDTYVSNGESSLEHSEHSNVHIVLIQHHQVI
ncbi:hypothetical protein SARC_02121 [Sphaeroforma arctica JP610]|uniref:Uncharacterized protein n=1 Tax=Sphaeroforma arctica JP610 TaxID=667725 RepID=A0A0L0GA05_9EUKA|nr:hypothetical protein SARC_02121 [Sphaeroforma arctica JP610]KNC85711.1 hypothetical protein SARC_02121 [Sphaeroforma arctica JP610]|eukprot:XP_014159613.1 hypothetical protein SARC_02121 [Sphaeroforma arctica JP610]